MRATEYSTMLTRVSQHRTNPLWTAVVQYGMGSDTTTVNIKRGVKIETISLCSDSDIACLWCDDTLYVIGAYMQPATTDIKGVHLVSWQQSRWDEIGRLRCMCVSESLRTLVCVRNNHKNIYANRLLQMYVDGDWETISEIPFGWWNTIVEITPGIILLTDRETKLYYVASNDTDTDVTGLIYDIAHGLWTPTQPGEKISTGNCIGVSIDHDIMSGKHVYESISSRNNQWLH